MSDGRRIRIVPTRNGMPLTRPWSFFSRGDEFYASSQAFLEGHRAKISFHSGGHWQFRLDTIDKRLFSNCPPDGNWIHALHVHFMIPDQGSIPSEPISPRTIRMPVPQGHKLRIDLLVSREPPKVTPEGQFEYPVEAGGDIYMDTLRSGNQILYVSRVQSMTPQDRKSLRSVIAQMPFLRYTALIDRKRVYAELTMLSVQPGTWNSVLVVPFPESYFWDPSTVSPNIRYWSS
jgi:hypothetical protein